MRAYSLSLGSFAVVGWVATALLAVALLPAATAAAEPSDPSTGAFDKGAPVGAPWEFATVDLASPRISRSGPSRRLVEEIPPEADPLVPGERLGMGTLCRAKRTGRGQWPRTVYQAPPFRGGFFRPGGIWRVENPKLFLMPFRASFLQEGSGLVGGQFEQRFWSNSIFSGGIELWGLARPNDHGDFYRVEGSFGLLLWLGTQTNIEFGILGGIERDVMLVERFDRRFGYEFGTTARMTAWRFELRADWLMRLGTDRLDTGDLRHSARLSLMFEPLRLGMFGLEVGGWAHFITGGPPRVGLSAGIRLWFSVGRSEPEYVRRWAGQTRD